MSDLVPVLVKLPSEVVRRIDERAGSGQRSRWIRDALDRALEGGARRPKSDDVAEKAVVLPRRSDRVRGAAAGSGFKRPDDGAVWAELRKKRGTARQLRDRLGWMEMRVDRAVSSLLAAGRVRLVAEGVLEAVE